MTINRRDFVKTGTIATTGLMLGMNLPMGPKSAHAAGTVYTPNAWVHISDDNIITLISARSEMGQGVYTSMPMLIAEELSVPIDKVKVALALKLPLVLRRYVKAGKSFAWVVLRFVKCSAKLPPRNGAFQWVRSPL
jgi:CO/xanthine dehydrogenase Mo-binding subunit